MILNSQELENKEKILALGEKKVQAVSEIPVKVAYSCIVLTILVVALILLCNVIPRCVLPYLGDNTS